MTININRYQSISFNQLILIIDDQSMVKILWLLIVIDYQYQSLDKLVLIGIDWLQIDGTGIDAYKTQLCT